MPEKKQTTNHPHVQRIIRLTGKAINRYGMINDGDRIAVGLSGGKDSLIMLETLALRRRHIPISYDIHAVHIALDGAGYSIDAEFTAGFCERLGVRYHHVSSRIDFGENSGLSPCFVCSRKRRRLLFEKTRDLGCNRLALGHHMNDIVETLLLSMIYNASISAMPPKLSMFNGEFDIIRPLSLTGERDIVRYAAIRGFSPQKTPCPFEKKSRRADIKNMLGGIERLHSKALKNIYWSMANIHFEYLPRANDEDSGFKEG